MCSSLLGLLLGVVACGDGQAATMNLARIDSVARAREDSVNRAQPGYIIDSILTVEEQLRRFRASVDTVHAFSGGAKSREALVRSFVHSLEVADTTALVRLAVSRAEFAWLVYPESPFVRPPYQQAPDLLWMQNVAASSSGLTRLLNRLGGDRLGFRGWSCSEAPTVEGSNRIWRGCMVRFDRAPDTKSLRLFSGIIERHGHFKIISYANGY